MIWMQQSPRRILVAAVAILLALVATAAFLLSRGDNASDVISSYTFESSVDAEQDPLMGDEDVLDTLRAWFAAPGMWRFEFGDFSVGEPADGTLLVSDGETTWNYSADTNTYYRDTTAAYLAGIPVTMGSAPPFPSLSFFLGPIPGEREAFLSGATGRFQVEERGDGPTIAGRRTEYVRFSFEGGTFTMWLDRQYPFVLAYESSNDFVASHVKVEITSVSINESIDSANFRFQPPPSSEELPKDTGSSSGSGTTSGGPEGVPANTPQGFFTPEYLPDAYIIDGTESTNAGDRVTSYDLHLLSPDGAHLDVEQQLRAGGMAESQRIGRPVAIGNATGYLRAESDVTIFTWSNGDIVITLTASDLTDEQLLTFAEALRLQP